MAEAIQREVTREVSGLLQLVFQDCRKSGQLDLEAVEMASRSALHKAGAASLRKVLQRDPPASDERNRACPCFQITRYREMRSRCILTVLGVLEITRPWFLCSDCGKGQVPFDIELDVEHKDLSPGVRRMLATVGSEAPFDHGRRQIELLAGLEISTKAVERTAESIGEDLYASVDQQAAKREDVK